MKSTRLHWLLIWCLSFVTVQASNSTAFYNSSGANAYLFVLDDAGVMIDAPSAATATGSYMVNVWPGPYPNPQTRYFWGITPAQMTAAGLNNNTATAAQKMAAGATPASPASITVPAYQNNSWTASPYWSGVAPTTYPTYDYSRCVTNTTGFVRNYRMTYTPSGGTATTENFSLQPGASRCYNITQTNSFTANLSAENVLGDGMGTTWVGTNETATATTPTTPPTVTNSGTDTNGNIWNNQDATNRLGAPPVASATTETRTDTSASTGDTLNRQKEANDEQRHKELKSLLAAQDRNEGIRDAIALDALNLGLNRLNASVNAQGQNVSNSVAGLRSSLEGGTNNAALTYGTNAASSGLQSGIGTGQTALGGLIPTVTVPAGVAPVLTLPFHHLHPDLEDAEFDFGDATLAPIVTTVRALELVGLTVLFFVLGLKLFGRTANV